MFEFSMFPPKNISFTSISEISFSLGVRPLHPLLSLRPWTPLGDFRPPGHLPNCVNPSPKSYQAVDAKGGSVNSQNKSRQQRLPYRSTAHTKVVTRRRNGINSTVACVSAITWHPHVPLHTTGSAMKIEKQRWRFKKTFGHWAHASSVDTVSGGHIINDG